MNKLISYISNSKIIRILIFGVGLIVLILVSTGVLVDNRDPKLQANLDYLENEKDKKFDILFFSNSYLHTAFNPLYLHSLTGLNSIHLGSNGRRIMYEELFIDYALENHAPKLVVVDISSFTLRMIKEENEKLLNFHSKALANIPFSIDKMQTILELFPENRHDLFFNSISLLTRNIYQLTYKSPFRKNKSNFDGGLYGFTPISNKFFLKKDKYKTTFDSIYNVPIGNYDNIYKTIDTIGFNSLMGLIEKFEDKKDINLLLVNTIKLNSNSENRLLLEAIKSKITSSNISILELNSHDNKKKLSLYREDFSDKYHPSISGSYKLTKLLSNFININYVFSKKNAVRRNSLYFEGANDTIVLEDFQLLNNPNYRKKIFFKLKKMNYNLKDLIIGINIYPKTGFETLLNAKSKKLNRPADNLTMGLSMADRVGDELVVNMNYTSNFANEEIDHITLWIWDNKNKKSTNRIDIKLSKLKS